MFGDAKQSHGHPNYMVNYIHFLFYIIFNTTLHISNNLVFGNLSVNGVIISPHIQLITFYSIILFSG